MADPDPQFRVKLRSSPHRERGSDQGKGKDEAQSKGGTFFRKENKKDEFSLQQSKDKGTLASATARDKDAPSPALLPEKKSRGPGSALARLIGSAIESKTGRGAGGRGSVKAEAGTGTGTRATAEGTGTLQ